VQCPFEGLSGRRVELRDLLGRVTCESDGDALAFSGAELDLSPWGRHVFQVTPV